MKSSFLRCCLFYAISLFSRVNCFEKIHLVSQIEFLNQSDEGLTKQINQLKRLYSTLYTFSSFHEAYKHIDYHLCIYYDSTEYFKYQDTRNVSYFFHLYEKHHPNVEKFQNPLHRHFLTQMKGYGLSLIFIPYEEISVLPERYLIDDNRAELLNLFCGLYLGRQLLTDPLYWHYSTLSQLDPIQTSKQDVFSFYEANPSISKHFFDYILFIHSNYVVVNNHLIRYITNNHNSETIEQYDFHCFPHVPHLNSVNTVPQSGLTPAGLLALLDAQQRLYDLSLYFLKIHAAIPLLLYFQSALMSNSQSISVTLQKGINTLSGARSLRLLDSERDHLHIVYAKRMYLLPRGLRANTLEEIQSIALLEFDDDNHRFDLKSEECSIQLHVQWPMFNTVQIIQSLLSHYLTNNDTRWNLLTYCEPICFNEKCMESNNQIVLTKADEFIQNTLNPLHSNFFHNELLLFNQHYLNKNNHLTPKYESSSKPKNDQSSTSRLAIPRIFDCILFFNELSLLKLRLSLLAPLVTKHLILESIYTFTGKKKAAVLSEHSSLFKQYRDKMDIIVLDHLPFPNPQKIGEVWFNEYYSRNYFHKILMEKYHIQWNDVIIVADTDEIVDPEIIILLSSMSYYSNYFIHSQSTSIAEVEQGREMIAKDLPMNLQQIYKLLRSEYLYDFSCYIPTLRSYFPSSSPAVMITTYQAALDHAERTPNPNAKDNMFFLLRMFLQYDSLLPSEYLMRNYVWHLSFFQPSPESVKEKLEAYSHQNFASQFFDDGENDRTSRLWRNEDSLPEGSISLEKIQQKIQRKRIINGKEFSDQHHKNEALTYLEHFMNQNIDQHYEANQDEGAIDCDVRDFYHRKSDLLELMWNEATKHDFLVH